LKKEKILSKMKLWQIALAATAIAAFVFAAPVGAAGSNDLNAVKWVEENGFNVQPSIAPAPAFVRPEVNNVLATVTWSEDPPDNQCTNLDTEDFSGGAVAPGGAIGCTGIISQVPDPTGCFPGGVAPGLVFREQPGLRGFGGTVLWGIGFLGAPSNGIGANFFVDSYSVRFGPPLPAITAIFMNNESTFFGGTLTNLTVLDLGLNPVDSRLVNAFAIGSDLVIETDFAVGGMNSFSPSNSAEGWNFVHVGDECIHPRPTGGSCDLGPVLDALEALEDKADAAESKLDALEAKADRAEGKLDKLQNDVDNMVLMLKELVRLAITPHGRRETNCIGPAGHPDGKDMPSWCDMPIPFTNGGGNLRQR
jgi:hypothetical protein